MSKMNCAVITDGNMGSNITSNPIRVNTFPVFAIHWWISSTTPNATGTLKLQASCEWDNANPTAMQLSGVAALNNYVTNWVTVGDPIAITSGSPLTGIINGLDLGYSWVRVVYTASSGSGTLQVRIQAKHGIP
jgi:hypothetical protein